MVLSHIFIFECVLLDILVGHVREMHGKWAVHGRLLFLA